MRQAEQLQSEQVDWSASAMCAFDIVACEFVVVTADGADLPVHAPLQALLRRIRQAFGVEAAFISEWSGGAPVVRRPGHVTDDGSMQECNPVEVMYGAQVVGADRPAPDVRFHAVPVITAAGLEHGTLCCRCQNNDPRQQTAAELRAVRAVAALIAQWFDDADLSLSGLAHLSGESVMGGLAMSC